MTMTNDEVIYVLEQLKQYKTEDKKLVVKFFLGCEMVPRAIIDKMLLDKRNEGK